MRRVEDPKGFEALFLQAQNETQSTTATKISISRKSSVPSPPYRSPTFGRRARYVIHLGERDCSLQRNNQKVIELAPAVCLDEDTRKAICGAAVKCSRPLATNAGTIEFSWLTTANFTSGGNEHPFASGASGDRDDYRVDNVQEQIKIAMSQLPVL